jgi:hypothetical protein
MRVLICGDRNWSDFDAICDVVASLPSDAVVIEGEARGADSMARRAAEMRGLKVERYPAKWDEFGKRAGPIRNHQMLKEGSPTHVIYFHDSIEASKGTAHMVAISRSAGVPVVNGRQWPVEVSHIEEGAGT